MNLEEIISAVYMCLLYSTECMCAHISMCLHTLITPAKANGDEYVVLSTNRAKINMSKLQKLQQLDVVRVQRLKSEISPSK